MPSRPAFYTPHLPCAACPSQQPQHWQTAPPSARTPSAPFDLRPLFSRFCICLYASSRRQQQPHHPPPCSIIHIIQTPGSAAALPAVALPPALLNKLIACFCANSWFHLHLSLSGPVPFAGCLCVPRPGFLALWHAGGTKTLPGCVCKRFFPAPAIFRLSFHSFQPFNGPLRPFTDHGLPI